MTWKVRLSGVAGESDFPGDDGANDNLWINEPGRSDDLLYRLAAPLQLKFSWRSTCVERLPDTCLEFIEGERAIVDCARKPEAMLNERILARPVPRVHRTYLRYRGMRFVDNKKKVSRPIFLLRKVVEERIGRLAVVTPIKVPRIILDAITKAEFAYHRYVLSRAAFDTLCL